MNQNSTLDAAKSAAAARIELADLDSPRKNRILGAMKAALEAGAEEIFAANREDLAAAEKDGLDAPLLKRLKFDAAKLAEVADGLDAVAALADPVGAVRRATELDDGLELYQVSCPIGVIAMIFESRPDALVQMAGLSLKSGNAVLLKGGREAARTNAALSRILSDASVSAGAPAGWMQILESREQVSELLGMDQYVDLIIPRGSNEFVRHIMTHTLIPVMGHADGICHVYAHADADLELAVPIIVDSKTQYVAVCNAAETLLVHRDLAPKLLPRVAQALAPSRTRLRGCEETARIIDVEPASESDWDTEYLDYILSIKIVGDLDEAIDFINLHGSGHTDAILTRSDEAAKRFMARVDSASVLANCSTRFADGFRYGLGAEVGISTGKLHARGPVGLEGLVSYKYQLFGHGQIVADYSEGRRAFTHRDLPGRPLPTVQKQTK